MNREFWNSDSAGLKIHFPGTELKHAVNVTEQVLSPRFRVGWYLKGLDVNSASIRYRCYHFARVLSAEFDNSFYSKYQDLKDNIQDLDLIIVVKRLDRYVVELASLARYLRKPLILDLCDDLANPADPSLKEPCYALTTLLAVAPAVSGIVVPSAEMADRIEGYLEDNGLSGRRCHVIPDIAETRELFEAARGFVSGELVRSSASRTKEMTRPLVDGKSPRRIVWFGNYGGMHSNFGIYSLRPKLKSLRTFHREQPIELIVISNNTTIYQSLFQDCGFPTRYIEWTSSAVYDELERADAALLTTGDDRFCDVKSSNRILQALAASVPVLTDKLPSLAEFEEVIFSGKFLNALEECLGDDREKFVPAKMAAARSILQRYTPERLGAHWAKLINQAIGSALVRKATEQPKGVMLVFDAGDAAEHAQSAVQAVDRTARLDYELLVSTDLLKNVGFRNILRKTRALPKFFSGEATGIEHPMGCRSAVILGNPLSKNGKLISQAAKRLGMEVVTHADAATAELERFAPRGPGRQLAARKLPGPFPEWTEADGSVRWAFVINNKARGWILDAICQEIGSRQPSSWKVVDQTAPPPPTRNLFFSHFSLLDLFDKKFPRALKTSDVFVWYTHPRDETDESIARNLSLFSQTTKTIFTCESNRQTWVDRGLAPERTEVVLGAADPRLFKGHERGGGAVGLSSSFYERKNPDLMLNIIKAMPHRQFVLLGRHWNRYAGFEELMSLPNFTYLTRTYREYPRIYATFDVFLSISSLEGGPIPLIEAMMSNVVPVASNTGFAPDVIEHGSNGFIFDVLDKAENVCELIERAYALETDVRKTVEKYSWDAFSAAIVSLGS